MDISSSLNIGRGVNVFYVGQINLINLINLINIQYRSVLNYMKLFNVWLLTHQFL